LILLITACIKQGKANKVVLMNLSSYSVTDVGLKREGNEDAILVDEGLGLYILSDGMGGHAAGEVASKITVDTIHAFLKSGSEVPSAGFDGMGEPAEGTTQDGRKVIYSILSANRAIIEDARLDGSHTGMGSTVLVLYRSGDNLLVAHIGDSRVYLLRGGEFKQLTMDHTVYNIELSRGRMTEEQLENSPFKSRLARAMGHLTENGVDLSVQKPQKGDIFLLCSDGLTDMVNDDNITLTIKENRDDLKSAGDILVKKAKEGGGKDNISVILVGVD